MKIKSKATANALRSGRWSPHLFPLSDRRAIGLLVVLAGLTVGCSSFHHQIAYPANASRIFSDYDSMWSPGGKRDNRHTGLDIEGRRDDRPSGIGAPVLAAADGTVVISGWSNSSGNRILIDHGADEDGKYLRTLYLHNSENLVGRGEKVKRGQQIATVGHTGGNRGRYPHLHFEVSRGATQQYSNKEWSPVNPHDYWYNGAYRVTCLSRKDTIRR